MEICPNFSEFSNFSWLKYFRNCNSGYFVPVKILPQIVRDLDRLSKLKAFI